jgi:hypothetical protein
MLSGRLRLRPQHALSVADGAENMGWKDHVAMFIALLQTVALPILVLIVVILIALVLIRAFA